MLPAGRDAHTRYPVVCYAALPPGVPCLLSSQVRFPWKLSEHRRSRIPSIVWARYNP